MHRRGRRGDRDVVVERDRDRFDRPPPRPRQVPARRRRTSRTPAASTVSRHHQARPMPAAPPHSANAQACRPATCRGSTASRAIGSRRPTIVAMPSPAARMPQAAATMSRRLGKSKQQQQHRQRIEHDAGSEPPQPLARTKEPSPEQPLQAEEVEERPRSAASTVACHHGISGSSSAKPPIAMWTAWRESSENGCVGPHRGCERSRVRHQASRSASVLSIGISGRQPVSALIRDGSPSTTGLSLGRSLDGSCSTVTRTRASRDQPLEQIADPVARCPSRRCRRGRPCRQRRALHRRAPCRERP